MPPNDAFIKSYHHLSLRSVYVTGQVHSGADSPGSLGHVAVRGWTGLGHGVVSHTRRGSGLPVRGSGLPPGDGRPALRQQDAQREGNRSAVGDWPAGVQPKVFFFSSFF